MTSVIALALDTPTMLVIGVVGVVVLGVAWFGMKFWLASTRPADIKDVKTPTLDRLNQQALEAMGGDASEEEEENEEAPAELKKIVPENET